MNVNKHDKVENVRFSKGSTAYWVEIEEITIFFKNEKEVIAFKNMVLSEYEAFNKRRIKERGVINNAKNNI